MKNHLYKAGAVLVTLAMSGMPAIALAENNNSEGSSTVEVTSVGATTSESGGQNETVREQQKQAAEVSREQQKQQLESSSSTRPSIQGGDREGQEIEIDLEDGEVQVTSTEGLKQDIEKRKHELEQEVASSTPDHKRAVENANPVRLAVHSLLASRDLLGTNGIGQQVSEIAKEVNDSVASTTNAEAKIQSRGFLTRFLFGGDTTSADVIAQEAAKNQARIDSLTALLAQANISAEVQATLNAQITALKDAQARLQDLALKEQKAWGLFSWRF